MSLLCPNHFFIKITDVVQRSSHIFQPSAIRDTVHLRRCIGHDHLRCRTSDLLGLRSRWGCSLFGSHPRNNVLSYLRNNPWYLQSMIEFGACYASAKFEEISRLRVNCQPQSNMFASDVAKTTIWGPKIKHFLCAKCRNRMCLLCHADFFQHHQCSSNLRYHKTLVPPNYP